jgi:hypothetical protein
MKRPFIDLCVLTILVLICSVPPASGQISTAAVRPSEPTGPFAYDVSKETTVSGSVAVVLAKPAAGMIMGSHLLVETSSGMLDASLGRFALQGKDAISLTPGQHVEVTGIMKTLNNQQVFLARTLKVDDQVYTIRNKHGVTLSPQARERLSQTGGQL